MVFEKEQEGRKETEESQMEITNKQRFWRGSKAIKKERKRERKNERMKERKTDRKKEARGRQARSKKERKKDHCKT